MRLAPNEIELIKHLACAACGPGTVVRLFGSQLDDARRGGDIDLMVEIDSEPEDALLREGRLLDALEAALGERKVDLVVQSRGRPDSPIAGLARVRGRVL
jgi:predicted nucleotidyltransferase